MSLRRTFAALAAVSALAGGTALAQDKTIKIVTHSPLSGPQSGQGETISLGSQIALIDFGKALADMGFKVSLQPEDDQATPNVGVANANRILNDTAVLAVVGHLNSGVAIPSSEVYAKDNLVMVSPANTNPAVTERASTKAIVNRVCGRDDIQGPAGANFTTGKLAAQKVYIINDKSAYGAGIAATYEAAIKKNGGTVIFSTGVDEKETDFSAILNRARVDNPDAIYYGGSYPQGGLLIKQIRQKGIKAKIVGADGLDSSDTQKIAGAENMTDVYFTTTAVPLSKLPAAASFAAAYKAKFNKDPESYSVYSYDAARVVIQGITDAAKAKGGAMPTRAEVAAAVRKVKLEGLTGPIEFTAKGDPIKAKYVVIQAGTTYGDNKIVDIVEVPAPASQ